MNTQEIKKQAHKEFDENFEFIKVVGDRTFKDFLPFTYGEIESFIDSLIDKTVLQEQERIVGKIEDICEDEQCDDMNICTHKIILSLITNKSDK